METPNTFDVDSIVDKLLMWLRNHLDPSDLTQLDINILDQWAPKWRDEFMYYDRKIVC